jgi:ribosome-binding ATPase YchF (GTP1/OBG family)
MKPVIYAANVSDADMAKGNDLSKIIFDFAASEGSTAVLVSAQVEFEYLTSLHIFCYYMKDKIFLAVICIADLIQQ